MKPGEEIIKQGLADLEQGLETIPSLLVSIGSPRLRRAGVLITSPTFKDPENRLYALLQIEHDDNAHSQYNPWLRKLVSYERALESEKSARSKSH